MAEYTKAQLTDMIIGKLQRNFGRTVEEATKVLEERSKAGILPREPRKGFYKLYTDHALSAMKGAGLE